MMIEFSFGLDLSNPYDAQWVERERGQIVIQRITKVYFFDSVEIIKKQDCRVDANLY